MGNPKISYVVNHPPSVFNDGGKPVQISNLVADRRSLKFKFLMLAGLCRVAPPIRCGTASVIMHHVQEISCIVS